MATIFAKQDGVNVVFSGSSRSGRLLLAGTGWASLTPVQVGVVVRVFFGGKVHGVGIDFWLAIADAFKPVARQSGRGDFAIRAARLLAVVGADVVGLKRGSAILVVNMKLAGDLHPKAKRAPRPANGSEQCRDCTHLTM